MRKIVILFLIICALVYALKSMDNSFNKTMKSFTKEIEITELSSPPMTDSTVLKSFDPPIVESKINVVPPAQIVRPREIDPYIPPPTQEIIKPEPTQQLIENGKKVAQQGQEVICDTYIPRCVNFQYFFRDVSQDLWDQPVSCLSKLSNCVDQSKYEIPSDEEVVSIYQAPNNDMDYQEYLKRKRIERGEVVEEYSY